MEQLPTYAENEENLSFIKLSEAIKSQDNDDLYAIKDILEIIGEYGYSIQGAIQLLDTCKVAIMNCTCVNLEYKV